jgi:hypothetical protein
MCEMAQQGTIVAQREKLLRSSRRRPSAGQRKDQTRQSSKACRMSADSRRDSSNCSKRRAATVCPKRGRILQ